MTKHLSLIFVLLISSVLTVTFGQDTTKLRGLEQNVQSLEQNLQTAKAIRAQQAARAAALETELRNLGGQESKLSSQVRKLNNTLNKLELDRLALIQAIEKNQKASKALVAQIAKLNQTVTDQKKAVQELIVSIDRERSSRYVKLLARADNVYDLVVKSKDLNTIGENDLNVIDALKKSIAQREQKNLELQKVIAQLNANQRFLETKKDAITRNRGQLNASIAQLRRTAQGRKVVLLETVKARQRTDASIGSILNTVFRQRQALKQERARILEIRRQAALIAARKAAAERARARAEERRIARLKSQRARAAAIEQERIRQLKAAQQAANAQTNLPSVPAAPIDLPASLGRLSQPIPGGRITANFGQQGEYMAIQADQAGAAVYAAADGQVARVTLVQANSGYTVIIAHTDSIWTVYQNMQDPPLEPGQVVRRGQFIGYVGGGAINPADQLQFAVAVNGVLVDPRPYF
jgi:murein DD-endopeptidase MepM/ murein hydrolase activator NlpD